jgi:hypothetical protein
VVLADYTISTTVGRYQIHIVHLITQVVPADYTMSTIVGQYHIYIVYLFTWYQPIPSYSL